MFASDAGSEQVGCHNILKGEFADLLNTWYVRQFCFLHQLALIVKNQLAQLGKHFGDVATLMNVWRAVGNAVKFYKQWSLQYGKPRADKVAHRLPPKAISGRWGAIHASEQYLLAAGRDQTASILPLVLSPQLVAPKPPAPVDDAARAEPAPLADVGTGEAAGGGAAAATATASATADDKVATESAFDIFCWMRLPLTRNSKGNGFSALWHALHPTTSGPY